MTKSKSSVCSLFCILQYVRDVAEIAVNLYVLYNKTKYEKSEDGWYYFVPQGEAMMFLQADNYALWVGERPSNTTWVNDKFGGHGEWTD